MSRTPTGDRGRGAHLAAALLCVTTLAATTAAVPPSETPAVKQRPEDQREAPTEQTPKATPKGRAAESAAKEAVQVTLHEWTTTRASSSPTDDADQAALGRLVYSKLDVVCEDAKVGDAVRALSRATGINIAMKFDIEFVDDSPVFLELHNVDGLTALEAIIAQGTSGNGDGATWQLRRGIVEIGSKRFLARSTGRRIELYDVSTLVFDVPYSPSGQPSAPPPIGVSRATTRFPRQFQMGPDPDVYRRKAPVELAADLMQTIVNQVEREAWDPLPPDGEGAGAGEETRGPEPRLPDRGRSNGGLRNRSTLADRNFDASAGPPFVRGKWASMDYHRQNAHLIVSAPDFVHRGLGGYPEPLPVAVGD